MIDEEFVITHLENRIKDLIKQKNILIENELLSTRNYWSISGIISGLQEALDLLTI